MNFKVLHEEAKLAANTYLKSESRLIEILRLVEECRGYQELEMTTLHQYALSLGLSEYVAYNLTSVAKKARDFPAMEEKIKKQEMSLSNAKMIVPILTQENQTKWLEAASMLSKRKLEKEIAREFPKQAVAEQSKYVSENRLELKLGVSEKLLEKLKRIQDLESKSQAATLEAALEAMADLYLEKNDPLEKAKRARNFAPATRLVPGLNTPKSPRMIPAYMEHEIQTKAGSRCTHVHNGVRCQERRWLEIHHIQPISQGGQTKIDNLVLLCRRHHQLTHIKSG